MSKFKVGDKVRVIGNNEIGSNHHLKRGYEGIITKLIDREEIPYMLDNDELSWVEDNSIVLVESKKEENSDITKDLKKAIGFLDLHDKDQFMLDNIVATLEDRIDEIRSS